MTKLAQTGDAGKYAALYAKLRSSGLSDPQFILSIAVQDGSRVNKKPVNPHTDTQTKEHVIALWKPQ